jgi:hypothetical protein
MHAVVEEIRLRDLHPSDKHLSTSSCAGLSIDRIRGEGDATAWTQGLSCLSGEGLISLHPLLELKAINIGFGRSSTSLCHPVIHMHSTSAYLWQSTSEAD